MNALRSFAGFLLHHDGQKTPYLGLVPSEGPASGEYSQLPCVGGVRLRNDGNTWFLQEFMWGEDYTKAQQATALAETIITDEYIPPFRPKIICVDVYNGGAVSANGYWVKFDLPMSVPFRRRFLAQKDYRYSITKIYLDSDTATSIEIYLMR
jgi:hypothetical protein